MNFSFLNIFALGATPPEHTITDNTNYAGQGIVAANVEGLLKLTGPTGTAYYANPGYINDDYSAPDIFTPAFAKTVPLPLNGDGLVEPGDYYLDYKIRALQTMSYPIVAVPGLEIVSVPGDIQALLAGALGLLTIAGSTGNDGTYTIQSYSYSAITGYTTIVLSTVSGAFNSPIANGTISFQVYNFYQATQVKLTYDIDTPCGKLEVTSDCGCAKLSSRDVTNYGLWTVAVRTHTLVYPVGSNVADVVSASALIQIADLYTNTYVSQLSVDISYSPSSGFTITNTITAQKDTKVVCDAGMCCIYSCMKSVVSKYVDFKANGSQAEAQRYQNIVIKIFGYWMLYSINNHCGNEDEMASNLALIKALINTECGDCCTDDCNNGDTTAVIPLCGPNGGGGGSQWIYSVVPCGNNLLTVTTNVVADTVIYTVCVSEAQLTAFIENVISTSSIGDLGDVSIVNVENNQVLVWNQINQAWENIFLTLNGLSDVDVTTHPIQDGDILVWDQGTQTWINQRNSGILYNVHGIVATDAGVGNWQDLYDYDVPAASLDRDGSEVRFTTGLILHPFSDVNNYVSARIQVGGFSVSGSFLVQNGASDPLFRVANQKDALYALCKVRVIRINPTTVKVISELIIMYGFLFLGSYTRINEFAQNIAVADLDANILNINVAGRNDVLASADRVKSTHLMVERVIKII